MGEIMLFVRKGFSFISVSIFVASLALTGCSSLPWSDETDDEDLFFEEDFGSEFESELKDAPPANKDNEDDFFKDDKQLAESSLETEPQSRKVPVSPDEEDFFFEDDKQSSQARPKTEPKPRATPQVSPEEDVNNYGIKEKSEKETSSSALVATNAHTTHSNIIWTLASCFMHWCRQFGSICGMEP